MFEGPRTYGVMKAKREPLVRFMREGLESQGCRIIYFICAQPRSLCPDV